VGITVYALDPSRCYFQKSLEKPLNGFRILEKNNFDIAGNKTTLCNKAWRNLYSVSSEHALTIRSLLENGAITIGKTKLNAMIIREETMECVEYLAAFNPRGDGYQTSPGRSSESCAALVAYDWLDFAIGSDTNGSCRKPAHWEGVFAIRPTHGILSINGVSSSFP
jgi:Asp-tRNA(Asn)/Glu-tRNA(Gln) amidotransferase A subunit family amidase